MLAQFSKRRDAPWRVFTEIIGEQNFLIRAVLITDLIKSLSDLQKYCNLQQADSDRFFNELQKELPPLNLEEQAAVNRIKRRYDYHWYEKRLVILTPNKPNLGSTSQSKV